METKSSLSYAEQDYIISHSLKCKLLIQPVEDHVFIGITDRKHQLRYIEKIPLGDLLQQTFFFENLKFDSSLLLSIPETFAFMPFQMTDERSQHHYDALLLSEDKEHIFQEKMPHTEIINRFTVRQSSYDIRKKIREVRFIPSSNMLIKNLEDQSRPEQKTIGIQVYPQEFELAYFVGKKFMYYNRFPMAGADDFNYFLLAVLEQFEIATGEAHVYLSGEIDQGDALYQRLQKYTDKLAFTSADIKLPKALATVPVHRHALLWELATCESLAEH